MNVLVFDCISSGTRIILVIIQTLILYRIITFDGQALVRKADEEVVDMLPTSVEIVTGDVGEPSTLKAAVEGCNKIIYCATARSSITGDLNRVDHLGVYNLTKALQV